MSTTPGEQPPILLVTYDLYTSRALGRILAKDGITESVDSTEKNIDEIAAMVKERAIKVIVMDWSGLGKNAVDAFKAAGAERVIVIDGSEGVKTQEILDSGALRTPKPYNADELSRMVRGEIETTVGDDIAIKAEGEKS